MTHKDLMQHYQLEERMLHELHDKIIEFLSGNGIRVSFIDMEPIIEADVYGTPDIPGGGDKHHESCLSDGMEIYLHNNMEDIGGICSRLYDMLHMGCGHLWQWSGSAESNLKFYAENAWKIGSTYYLGAEDDALKEVWEYEEEAGALALANLKQVFRHYYPDERAAGDIIRFFNDYLRTDLDYITTFYKTNEVVDFFKHWQFDAEPIREISPHFKLHITRRTNKCIALLNKR